MTAALEGQAAVPAAERAALVDLYTQTNGASWLHSGNWLTGDPCDNHWYGIECNLAGTAVTNVVLDGNHLAGTLPATLNQLSSVSQINLSHNALTGGIPSLSGMTALSAFYASGNQFDGGIGSLAGLTALTDFRVPQNRLTGPIPDLAGLTALRTLDLSLNQLSGPIPALTGLVNLQWLNLYRNALTGPVPALTGLTALTWFDVSANQLSGALPGLEDLSALTTFIVHNNALSGNVPAVPVSNHLLNGESALCPNAFTVRADAAWDAATADTPWSASCVNHYTVTPVPAAGGDIFPLVPQHVGPGGIAQFEITPQAGYGVIVGGSCVVGESGSIYTVAFVTADCTVEPVFRNTRHTVTLDVGPHGTVTPAGPLDVLFGSYVTLTITPDAGYRLQSLQTTCGVNGYKTAGPDQYTLNSPIAADCTVTVRFGSALPVHTVTAAVTGGHGGVSPASRSVTEGTSTSFAVTPDAGYETATATGCGGTLAGNTYSVPPVFGPCAVTVSFAPSAAPAAAPLPVPTLSTTSLIVLGLLLMYAVRPRRNTSLCLVIPAVAIVLAAAASTASAQTVNTIDVSGTEVAGGQISFPVVLDAAPSAPVTVQWSVADGTATFPADYGGPTSGTLTFLPQGPLGQFVHIPIAVDAVNDSGETLTFTLGSPSPGVTLGNSNATGTIYQTVVACVPSTLTFAAGPHGAIDPSPYSNNRCSGFSRELAIRPDSGYEIDNVGGCGGLLVETTYVVPPGPDCTVTASFRATAVPTAALPVPGLSPLAVIALAGLLACWGVLVPRKEESTRGH